MRSQHCPKNGGRGATVVEGELTSSLATVLAREAVSVEDGLSGQPSAHHGPLHHVDEADDGRSGKHFRNALDMTAPIHYKLSLATSHQDDGASHVADVERLVILVEHQNRRINCAHSTPSGGLVCQKLSEVNATALV